MWAKYFYKGSLAQFVKFGVVGLANAIIYFLVYYGLLWMDIHYMVANIIAWIFSVFNAFYWNQRYVFKREGNWLRFLLRTYLAYGSLLFVNAVLLFSLVEMFGISNWVGPWIVAALMIPISFFANKWWTFQ